MAVLRKRADRQAAAFESAKAAVKGFWAGNGSEESLATARARLKELRLTREQIHELRAGLPLGNPGITGTKVTRIDRALKRLVHETA